MKKSSVIGFLILSLMLSLLPFKVSAQNEGSTWSMYRPSQSIDNVRERVQNASTDEEASVGIGVHIVEYHENKDRKPYLGRDGLTLLVTATGNTRKGINYQSSWGLGSMDWIEANTPIPGMDPPGDDDGVQVDLPFPVRFYGGPGVQNKSAEYYNVWVSSNGFLSFDSNSTSPNPKGIPDPSEPNTLLAVYWSDLDPSEGTIKYYADADYFVVTWRNVLDKANGQYQTFEVIISNARPPGQRGQNKIEFLYESVVWSASARAGIEDQEGYKGTGLPGIPSSGTSVHFIAANESPEIKEITIKLEKCDSYAEIYPTTSDWSLEGYNVQYLTPDPDTDGLFENALWGYGTLLFTTFLGAIAPVSAFMVGATLVTIDLVPDLARVLYRAHELDHHSADQSDDVAYINASAAHVGEGNWPVDALLGDQIEWVFTDDNDQDHSVTVTAELEYYSYQTYEIETISTSVDLTVKIGHTLTISTSSGGTTDPTPGTDTYDHGDSVTVTASAYSSHYFDYWLLDGATEYANPITVTMNSDHDLTAYFEEQSGGSGGGSGGCPILSVYDGTEYVLEGLLGIHNPDGIDMVTSHVLIHTPEPVEHRYLLRLTEHPKTYSYIDQVQLYATLENGTEMKLPLVSAVHSEDGNVVRQLFLSDDVRADLVGADHNNGISEWIDLRFVGPDGLEIEQFTFVIEGHNTPEFEK